MHDLFLIRLKMTRVIEGHIVRDIRLQKPFRIIVAGGSGCGKTEFVKKLVNKSFFETKFTNIVYVYPDYLPEIPADFNKRVQYHAGLPKQQYFAALPRNTLVIIDDMMTETSKSEEIVKLFSVTARKRDISLILMTQNIYHTGKHFRNIRLNASGFVLFKFFAAVDVNIRFLRDLGLSKIVKRSMLEEIYSERYKYIFIDTHPNRHSDFATVRGNIFSNIISVFNKMEYIAISKADFIKYFKIIEAKNNQIKAIENEVTVKRNKRKHPKKKIQKLESRDTEPSCSDTADSVTESESD